MKRAIHDAEGRDHNPNRKGTFKPPSFGKFGIRQREIKAFLSGTHDALFSGVHAFNPHSKWGRQAK